MAEPSPRRDSSVTAKNICWHCQSEAGEGHRCQVCLRIQPPSKFADLFQLMGLPRKLDIDARELEDRFYDISRKCHPDYFQTGSEYESALAEEMSAHLNKAYRTLKDPISRAAYLLELEGKPVKETGGEALVDLQGQLFEIQMALGRLGFLREAGPEGEMDSLKKKLLSEREGLVRSLSDLSEGLGGLFKIHDSLVGEQPGGHALERAQILERIRTALAKNSYLSTLIRNIDRELSLCR